MTTPPSTPPAAHHSAGDEQSVDPAEVLRLLGDEYTRAVVAALGTESLPAREIAARAGISRPTVYRRLDRLEAAGVVTPTMTVDHDGHHRQAFEVAIDGLDIRLDGESAAPLEGSEASTAGETAASLSLSVRSHSSR
mgnify:FL=1|jgi:DNA-binding transcriptional ArsR family regulator